MAEASTRSYRESGRAQVLGITISTARIHMTNILSKLGVHTRVQALVLAVRHGVVKIR